MNKLGKKEPRMDTDEHGCDFLEKLLDGAEVEWKPLGEVADIYGGLTGKSKKDFEDGNAKYISYKNIFENIHIDFNDFSQVRVSENENQHDVRYGDVLFTGSSETAIEAGMSSAVTRGFQEEVYLNSFSFGVRFNKSITLIPEFSKYLFRSSFMRREIAKTASGVTRFNISKARFRKLLIPIPCPENPEKSLAIQAEIVRILDTFTELTAELTARKKQYNYYRDQLLTFVEGEVETFPLHEIAHFRNGKGHEKIIDENGSYIVVNSKFISTRGGVRKYSSEQLCPLFNNDVLMVMSDLPNGKALAKCFLVNQDDRYTLNQRIGAFSVKQDDIISTKFLFYILDRNRQLLRFDNGADQTNLRKGDILSIKIPVPSEDEQARIVAILDKFDTLTHSISEGLPREIELRQQQYEYYRDLLLNFPKPEPQTEIVA